MVKSSKRTTLASIHQLVDALQEQHIASAITEARGFCIGVKDLPLQHVFVYNQQQTF